MAAAAEAVLRPPVVEMRVTATATACVPSITTVARMPVRYAMSVVEAAAVDRTRPVAHVAPEMAVTHVSLLRTTYKWSVETAEMAQLAQLAAAVAHVRTARERS